MPSWALYKMPFLAAVRHQPNLWPLIGHIFGNWCELDIKNLPPNDRCVCRKEIDPQQFADVYSKTIRGKDATDWSVVHNSCIHGSQPMGELDPKDQHMAKLDLEDQPLNISDQWVDTFCDGSQSSSYHPDMDDSSSYHPKQLPI
ncbi:hypothetical protein GOBAR_DD23913 [Gossypium barbadense]|nr:hypothetical protein GOBAR_DD23913 [Gossypium barbadense]